jgi:hypothetical protein
MSLGENMENVKELNIKSCNIENIKDIDKIANKIIEKLRNNNCNCSCYKIENGLDKYDYIKLNETLKALIKFTIDKKIEWKIKSNIYLCDKLELLLCKIEDTVFLYHKTQLIYFKKINVDTFDFFEITDYLIQLYDLVHIKSLPLKQRLDNFVHDVCTLND